MVIHWRKAGGIVVSTEYYLQISDFVFRMVFRAEADYNKVSGVQRANWIKSIHIDP